MMRRRSNRRGAGFARASGSRISHALAVTVTDGVSTDAPEHNRDTMILTRPMYNPRLTSSAEHI